MALNFICACDDVPKAPALGQVSTSSAGPVCAAVLLVHAAPALAAVRMRFPNGNFAQRQLGSGRARPAAWALPSPVAPAQAQKLRMRMLAMGAPLGRQPMASGRGAQGATGLLAPGFKAALQGPRVSSEHFPTL